MSKTKQKNDPAGSEESKEPDNFTPMASIIRKNVISTLGRPPELLDVVVRELWNDYYRINVLTGVNMIAARMTHSFFVSVNSVGDILKSEPTMTRVYA